MNVKTMKGRYACSLLAALMLFDLAVVPVPAVGQVTITGSSRQITTGPSNHYDPAISGNIVSYTGTGTGIPQVYYHDLTFNTETQVTSGANGADSSDVFGDTIVYVDYSVSASGQVNAFRIGTGGGPLAPNPAQAQSSPGIGGSTSRRIVGWIGNGGTTTFDVFAKDLDDPSGMIKQITQNSAVKSHPNVSGTSIVYASQTGAASQIFVTDFDTLSTSQLTTTTGLFSSPDISGTHVVYQGVQADGNQDIFVYDLTTNVETRISLPGVQRNPHVSGDWVAFEDVASGTSAIRLYYIPTGQLFTAVSSTMSNAFLNDIDGTRVVYTGDATGSEQLNLYEFTPTFNVPFASFSANLIIFPAISAFAANTTFTLGAGGSPFNPQTDAVTFQLTWSQSGQPSNFTVTIPKNSFQTFTTTHGAAYVFFGVINGVQLVADIVPPIAGFTTNWYFDIAASPAPGAGPLNLPPAGTNPVTVSLTMSNNTGSASVTAHYVTNSD